MKTSACTTTRWLILAALVMALIVSAVEPRASRVAIITSEGERAVSPEVLSAVEARLSQAGVAFVEREQLQRILKEHALNANSLQRANERLKLGNLTAADLFLTISAIPVATNRLWRAQMVEVRTGVALNGTTVEELFVATNTAALVDLVRRASTRLAVPHEVRRYVGIAGFRSEELNRSLDGLAESLGGMVPLELGNSPRVVVLDRENLVAIASEDALTDAGVDLRPATTWIEGFLRRLPDGGKVRVTLLFHPLPEGEPRRITVTSVASLNELGREVARAILDELKIAPDGGVNADRKAEAGRFAERAAVLSSHQKYEAAARAMDAALALAPSRDYLLLAAHYWNNTGVYADDVTDRVRQNRKPLLYNNPTPEVQAWFLGLRLRASELYLEFLREHIAANKNNPRALADVPALHRNALRGPYEVPAETLAPAAREIFRELQRVHLEIYRLKKACFEADWDEPEGRGHYLHPQARWCQHVGTSLGHMASWTDDVTEWMALVRGVLHDMKTRSFDASDRSEYFVWEHLLGSSGQRKLTHAERVKLGEFYESLARDENELVRLAALRSLHGQATSILGNHDVRSGLRLLDEFIRSMPVDHPARVRTKDFLYPFIVVIGSFLNVALENGHGDYYARAILEPILDAKLADRLPAWKTLAERWMQNLEQNRRTNELAGIAGRFLDLIENSPPQPKLESFTAYLRQVRARYGTDNPRAVAAWSQYEFQSVPLPGKPPGHLGAVVVDGDDVLLAWLSRVTRATLDVELTRWSVTSGAHRSLGRARVENGAHGDEFAGVHIVPATNAVYVFSAQGGAAVFRDGRAVELSESNGLPVNAVQGIVALNGKSYFVFPGAVFEYGPETGRFTELISSSSSTPRHALDGGERFYPGVLPDEARNCLWLSIFKGTRSGLWRFALASNTVEMVSDSAIGSMHWSHGAIRGTMSGMIVDVSPRTLDVTPLVGSSNTNLFGAAGFGSWSRSRGNLDVVRLGDHLLTGWRTLVLRTAEARVPWELRSGIGPKGDLTALVEVSDGRGLAANQQGELWLIRRKKAESNQISKP